MERKDKVKEKNKKRVRYAVLDEMRGIVFVSMFLYHGMWDWVYMFDGQAKWYQGTLGYMWQQSICWSFIILSGFCWHLGRKKYNHAGIVFGVGILVTVVTCFGMPEDRVIFGVLTFLGAAAFITTLLQPILSRCQPFWGLIVSGILFGITRDINSGFLGFEGWRLLKLPEELYQNMVTTFLGFPSNDFYSTDYFSLFPWLFLFLCGYFLYCCVVSVKGKRLIFLEKGRIPILQWMGRHCLVLYLLHQPVLFTLLYLIQKL